LNAVGGIPSRTAICANLSPSGGDDTQAIQDALNACPAEQVVQLGSGTFQISGNGLEINRSNVVLRGNGPDATRLVKSAGTQYPVVIIGKRWFKYTQPVELAADGRAGAYRVTMASNPGYKVGEIVTIDALTDPAVTYWGDPKRSGSAAEPIKPNPARGWFCEYDRPTGQVVEIAAVTGNELTLSTPLHLDFMTARKAHIVRFAAETDGASIDATRYSGIENLAVSGGEGGDGGGNIHVYASAYSWVKNVVSSQSRGNNINLDGTFRCEVRDSYVHSTSNPTPGGDGYGLGLNEYSADNLYENNVVWNFNKMTVCRSSGGGNVFGYNYFQDGYGEDYRDIVEIGAGPNHYATAHFELFEGNEGFNFDTESYWGNSIYGVVFRNHWTGLRRSAAPLQLLDAHNRRAVGMQFGAWWYSFIGNVLGFSGQQSTLYSGQDFHANTVNQTAFVYEADPNRLNDDSVIPMWKLGYGNPASPDVADPTVLERTYRHGNFDYVSNAIAWDSATANHELPASLYLAVKPAFFGDNPWPWVTPENASSPVATLPARARFDALHP
jgi:hypothetical protein